MREYIIELFFKCLTNLNYSWVAIVLATWTDIKEQIFFSFSNSFAFKLHSNARHGPCTKLSIWNIILYTYQRLTINSLLLFLFIYIYIFDTVFFLKYIIVIKKHRNKLWNLFSFFYHLQSCKKKWKNNLLKSLTLLSEKCCPRESFYQH